jgi:hypothetical protein
VISLSMSWSMSRSLGYLYYHQPLDKYHFKMKIAAELVNRMNKHKSRFTMFSFVGHQDLNYKTNEFGHFEVHQVYITCLGSNIN